MSMRQGAGDWQRRVIYRNFSCCFAEMTKGRERSGGETNIQKKDPQNLMEKKKKKTGMILPSAAHRN